MLPHENCKGWEYEGHPERASLTALCARLDRAIARKPGLVLKQGTFDTRRAHRFMFRGLAPTACRCLAGSYRGAKECKAAHNYFVQVGQDSLVGIKPVAVALAMKSFDAQCKTVEDRFRAWRNATPMPTEEEVLLEFVGVLAKVLEKFFQIHPYANGNGHAGRFLVLVMMVRAGFPPASWSIDGKKDYGKELFLYRRGVKQPLEDFILDAVAG